MADDRLDRGLEIRREVMGEEYVAQAMEGANDLTREFQEFITRYAWSDIWGRPGLDRRMRSAVTMTALIALGREVELASHVRAARRNGLSWDEIREIIMQSAIYCGVPAANAAFRVARAVFDAVDGS